MNKKINIAALVTIVLLMASSFVFADSSMFFIGGSQASSSSSSGSGGYYSDNASAPAGSGSFDQFVGDGESANPSGENHTVRNVAIIGGIAIAGVAGAALLLHHLHKKNDSGDKDQLSVTFTVSGLPDSAAVDIPLQGPKSITLKALSNKNSDTYILVSGKYTISKQKYFTRLADYELDQQQIDIEKGKTNITLTYQIKNYKKTAPIILSSSSRNVIADPNRDPSKDPDDGVIIIKNDGEADITRLEINATPKDKIMVNNQDKSHASCLNVSADQPLPHNGSCEYSIDYKRGGKFEEPVVFTVKAYDDNDPNVQPGEDSSVINAVDFPDQYNYRPDIWGNYAHSLGGLKVNDILVFKPYAGEDITQLYVANDEGVFRSNDDGKTWVYLDNIGGMAKAFHAATLLAISGNNDEQIMALDGASPLLLNVPDMLYAGTKTGLLKSHDGGATWKTDSHLGKKNIRALLYVNKTNTLYAGTDKYGIYKGVYNINQKTVTWLPIEALKGKTVNSLLSTTDTGGNPIMYAGTNNGVYESVDGDNWLPAGKLDDSVLVLTSIKDDKSGNVTLYAGTNSANVYKYDNQLGSWSSMGEVGNDDDGIKALSSVKGVLYAGNSVSGIYKYDAKTKSWLQADDGLDSLNIRVLKTFDDKLYAGTDIGIFKGNDEDKKASDHFWKAPIDDTNDVSGNGLPRNSKITGIQLDGTKLYVSTSKGIFFSPDGGQNWQSLNDDTLPISDRNLQALAINGSNIYIATDGGQVYRSKTKGGNWKHLEYGDIKINPNPDSVPIIKSMIIYENQLYAAVHGTGVLTYDEGSREWKLLNQRNSSKLNAHYAKKDNGTNTDADMKKVYDLIVYRGMVTFKKKKQHKGNWLIAFNLTATKCPFYLYNDAYTNKGWVCILRDHTTRKGHGRKLEKVRKDPKRKLKVAVYGGVSSSVTNDDGNGISTSIYMATNFNDVWELQPGATGLDRAHNFWSRIALSQPLSVEPSITSIEIKNADNTAKTPMQLFLGIKGANGGVYAVTPNTNYDKPDQQDRKAKWENYNDGLSVLGDEKNITKLRYSPNEYALYVGTDQGLFRMQLQAPDPNNG